MKIAPKLKNPEKITQRIQRKLYDRARTRHKRAVRKMAICLDREGGVFMNSQGWV